jgi:hypothetical protein
LPGRTKGASTAARARAFLAAYRRTCNITSSAKAAGINPRQHYRWLEKYPKYAAAFESAQRVAADYLESVAIKRATTGWEEPVFYQGEECGRVRRFDGGLMQFLLRGAKPEKYRQSAEVTGPGGGPIQATLEIVFRGAEPKAA